MLGAIKYLKTRENAQQVTQCKFQDWSPNWQGKGDSANLTLPLESVKSWFLMISSRNVNNVNKYC